MAKRSDLAYTPLPARAEKLLDGMFLPDSDKYFQDTLARYAHVKPRPEDKEGDTELLEGATFTHHFILGPGDGEVVKWHYVEAGPKHGEVIVFLHGIPDAWYQWHMQMAEFSKSFRCIAPDLKGYGQSGKFYGDYRHEGVSEQLFAMLQLIGVEQFNIVTHDRGTVQADFIAANHPENVLRYARGEQHLFHFNPVLAPQGEIFANAAYNGSFDNPGRQVCWGHCSLDTKPLPQHQMERMIQEFSYPGIPKAVPRYFNSSSFRQEWLERRNRLLNAWKCSVMIMQGAESKTQPREFYEEINQKHIPNAKSVKVQFIPGGHFWPLESPTETTEALATFLRS